VVVFDGTGDGGVSVDGDSRPRTPRVGSRRLRDISHLYLSSRQPAAAAAVAPTRRALRVAVVGRGLASAESVASLAVQWARLGRRVVVVDLDPALPNAGFRLGLEPHAYLGAVLGTAPCVERAALGVRVLVAPQRQETGAELVAQAVAQADVVIVRLPEREPQALLLRVCAALASPAAATTMERAAARSPMFEAWMATARRPAPRPPRPAVVCERIEDLLDVAVQVGNGAPADALGSVPLRPLAWGAGSPPAWARVPDHVPPPRLPLALLDPEHAVARVFEGLAQALLAGLGRRPGGEARA
jgi:hypothetical protein